MAWHGLGESELFPFVCMFIFFIIIYIYVELVVWLKELCSRVPSNFKLIRGRAELFLLLPWWM